MNKTRRLPIVLAAIGLLLLVTVGRALFQLVTEAVFHAFGLDPPRGHGRFGGGEEP